MAIYDHIEEFAGKTVEDWEPDQPIEDPENTAYRISITWEESEANAEWTGKFEQFLADPRSGEVTGIVVGPWEEVGIESPSSPIVKALAAAAARLPKLTAIFLGDIIMEEAEISWIEQSDVSSLFAAYPNLEYFTVRGGEKLYLGKTSHAQLQELVVQTGGLDNSVVHQVLGSDLPNLEQLELWLGDDNYGANTTLEDLQPLLAGDRFPKLRYLGLCDSMITDEIAAAIANAPILERIEVLDLSLGTLSDTGAAALVASPMVKKLKKLDIHHHYCSAEMVSQLEQLGIEVDASEAEEAEEYDGEAQRYVAVSE